MGDRELLPDLPLERDEGTNPNAFWMLAIINASLGPLLEFGDEAGRSGVCDEFECFENGMVVDSRTGEGDSISYSRCLL